MVSSGNIVESGLKLINKRAAFRENPSAHKAFCEQDMNAGFVCVQVRMQMWDVV